MKVKKEKKVEPLSSPPLKRLITIDHPELHHVPPPLKRLKVKKDKKIDEVKHELSERVGKGRKLNHIPLQLR